VNGLDLIPSETVSGRDLIEATEILERNFGVRYDKQKIVDLFNIVKHEGWTAERFRRTFLWFLKNKRFPAWTIADFFDYQVPVFPYEWYLKQQNEAGPYRDVRLEMDAYRLPDGKTIVYKWKDGVELPFELIPYPHNNNGESQ